MARPARLPDRSSDPLALSIDLEPLVRQVVERLKPLLASGVEVRRDPAEEPHQPKRAYRTPEAAELLSISDREVRELIARGELDSIRIGRVRLVPSSAIDRFIDRKLEQARSVG